jgi:uncharacterized protein (TIGR03085 family)
MPHALDERSDLAATLRATAPQSPTLCGDWTAALLTAHLVQRERSMTETLGRLPVARLQRRAHEGLEAVAAATPYERLVDQFDAGPPRYSPWAIAALREGLNLLEYAVHHEDVRRADPATEPRVLPVARQRAMWQRLRLGVPFLFRHLDIGVRLEAPGFGTAQNRRAKRGAPTVTVAGAPLELAVMAFGRQPAARVAYDGPPELVAIVRETPLPI